MIHRNLIALLSCVFISLTAIGQESYMRLEIVNIRSLYVEDQAFTGFGWGYDRVTSNRTMWGAMLYSDYGLMTSIWQEEEQGSALSVTGDGTVQYYSEDWQMGLIVHSDYSLSDIRNFHFFIGPVAGILMTNVKQNAYSVQFESSGDEQDIEGIEGASFSNSHFIGQLGGRIGMRMGNYFSIYGGGGFYLGDREIEGNRYIKGPFKTYNPTYYEIGFAWLYGGY